MIKPHKYSLSFVFLALHFLSLFSQDPSAISANLGTSAEDQWQFAGNIKLNNEVRRMGKNFAKVEVIKLRNDDELLEEEVKNFVPPAVPLLAFTANWNIDGILINWIAPKASARKSLVLQRSYNGITWTDLIESFQTIASLENNQFLDSTIKIGTNLYRLKQIQHDGSETFSNQVAVEVLPELTHTTYLYPNPLIFGTLIELELFRSTEVEVKILDQNNKELAIVYAESCSMGKHFIELNMNGLPKGTYICSIRSGKKVSLRTVSK